jgi:hypothetical protein
MYKTTVNIGLLRKKKFFKLITTIKEKFPEYHLIVEEYSRGWFSTNYVIWVRQQYYISNILRILDEHL